MCNAITHPAEKEMNVIEGLYGKAEKREILGLRIKHKRVGKSDLYKTRTIN